MRKLIYYLSFIFALMICFGISACSTSVTQLSQPSGFELVVRTVEWDETSGAEKYIVYFQDEETETNEARFVLPKNLRAGEYEMEVMAVGDYKTYTDSEWGTFSFVIEEPIAHGFDDAGWEYTLMEDGQSYEILRGKADLKGELTIPASFKGLPVVKISDRAFYYFASAQDCGNPITGSRCNIVTTGITIPDTVTEIGKNAFACMFKLKQITIPDSVTEIGNGAFYGCTALKQVTLPKRLKTIPQGCFELCALAEISFPQGLEEIGDRAFKCSYKDYTDHNTIKRTNQDFTKISIPNSVKKIGDMAFLGCEKLQEINLPESLDWIGYDVFCNTAWLDAQPNGLIMLGNVLYGYKGDMPAETKLTIPSQVKRLASRCFFGQNNLVEVVISDGVKLIGSGVFSSCGSLKKVKLPADLTEVPQTAFAGCKSLVSIEIPSSVAEIGKSAFKNCTALEEVVLSNGLKSIGAYAFEFCSALKEIVLPNTLTSIEHETFAFCAALEKVVLSNTLTSIGYSAFRSCVSLKEIVLPASLEKLGSVFLGKCDNLSKIYYEKTQEDWEALQSNEEDLSNATIYYFSEEQPQQSGNYWRYVNGVPTVWEL